MKAEKSTTYTLTLSEKEATALAAMSTVVHDYLFSNPKSANGLAADINSAGRSGIYDLASVLVDVLPAFSRAGINSDALRNRLEGHRPIRAMTSQPDEAFERGAGLGN